jgi:hypothetical protein
MNYMISDHWKAFQAGIIILLIVLALLTVYILLTVKPVV